MEELKKEIEALWKLYNENYDEDNSKKCWGKIPNIDSLNLNDDSSNVLWLQSNGIAGIDRGANFEDGDLEIIKKQSSEIQSAIKTIIADQSNSDDFYKYFSKENKGLKKTYKVLANRILVCYLPDKLLAVCGDQINAIFEKLSITPNANTWLERNLKIVEWLNDNIEGFNNADPRKKSWFGWTLATHFNASRKYTEEKDFINDNYNVIYTGAPGTGKTYMAIEIAKSIVGKKGKWKMVQFHPSYDYTDFVEGIRPYQKSDKEGIEFRYTKGVFKQFCEDAAKDSVNNYVFIIDEINRGEVNKIFGELFFAIDPDKRMPKAGIIEDGGIAHKRGIVTQYDNIDTEKGKEPFKDGFYVPDNVFIIGTMNDIDRSVESLDFAFRRRFAWKEITWDYSIDSILFDLHKTKVWEKKWFNLEIVKSCIASLNKEIENSVEPVLGPAYCLGGSYLNKISKASSKQSLKSAMEYVWDAYIANIIFEYLRGTGCDISSCMKRFRGKFLEPIPSE